MPQAAYVLVLKYMTDISAVARMAHVPRWQFGNLGYEFLEMSTAAWSPVRPAAFRVALQLFMRGQRADLDEQMRLSGQVERRVRRAIGATSLPVDVNASLVEWVRRLSREYRVERSVAVAAGEGYQGVRLERLRQIVDRTCPEDVDSSSSEGEQ